MVVLIIAIVVQIMDTDICHHHHRRQCIMDTCLQDIFIIIDRIIIIEAMGNDGNN
jgi:hypothetical protein